MSSGESRGATGSAAPFFSSAAVCQPKIFHGASNEIPISSISTWTSSINLFLISSLDLYSLASAESFPLRRSWSARRTPQRMATELSFPMPCEVALVAVPTRFTQLTASLYESTVSLTALRPLAPFKVFTSVFHARRATPSTDFDAVMLIAKSNIRISGYTSPPWNVTPATALMYSSPSRLVSPKRAPNAVSSSTRTLHSLNIAASLTIGSKYAAHTGLCAASDATTFACDTPPLRRFAAAAMHCSSLFGLLMELLALSAPSRVAGRDGHKL